MNKNPYLHEVSFEKVINLKLPQYDNLNYNGILITYCAKGLIKRILKKVGFKIYSFPGPKGKREITQARKI